MKISKKHQNFLNILLVIRIKLSTQEEKDQGNENFMYHLCESSLI